MIHSILSRGDKHEIEKNNTNIDSNAVTFVFLRHTKFKRQFE